MSLTDLVIEWRDARKAIFDTQASLKATPEQFARLAVAEHALMERARSFSPVGQRQPQETDTPHD